MLHSYYRQFQSMTAHPDVSGREILMETWREWGGWDRRECIRAVAASFLFFFFLITATIL